MMYALEDFSPEYKNVLTKQEEVLLQMSNLTDQLQDLRETELNAREAWLDIELQALGNPKLSAQVEKMRLAYRDAQIKKFDFEEKIDFFKNSAIPLKRMVFEARKKAEVQALEAARADHQKLMPRIIQVMRELAELQEQERAIVMSFPYGGHRLLPSWRFMSHVPLGTESDRTSRLYQTVDALRSIGYEV